MANPEVTGQLAQAALTGAASATTGPYLAFKILGAACTVTTVGVPTLTSVEIERSDLVHGLWTSIEFVSGTGAVLIPYLKRKA